MGVWCPCGGGCRNRCNPQQLKRRIVDSRDYRCLGACFVWDNSMWNKKGDGGGENLALSWFLFIPLTQFYKIYKKYNI